MEGVVGTVAGGDFALAGVAGGASFLAPFLAVLVFAGVSSSFSAAGSLAKETFYHLIELTLAGKMTNLLSNKI
jgi:hypothetical protein